MKDKFVQEIATNVYLISEFGMTNCFLVVGKEKAILIDTGNGIHNIKKVVEKLTSLPITVLLTHGHPDHAGGCVWFDDIYMHQSDNTRFFKISMQKRIRYIMAKYSPAKEYNIKHKHIAVRPKKLITKPMQDGDIFELGGKTVTAIHTAGHTKGSMVFLINQDKLIITGDNVCRELWMFLPGSTSLEKWLIGAEKIYKLTETHKAYNGHDQHRQTREQIAKTISLAKEIISKSPYNSRIPRLLSYPKKSEIKIIYRSNNRVN